MMVLMVVLWKSHRDLIRRTGCMGLVWVDFWSILLNVLRPHSWLNWVWGSCGNLLDVAWGSNS